MVFPIKGSCQCGQLTYQLFKKPNAVWACHCSECQKLSSSPFSITAMVDSKTIKFKGELKEWSRSSDSGNMNVAKFCPYCGNRVYHYNPDDLEVIKLKLKPVNLPKASAALFEPTAHVWVSEKLNWYQLPKGIKVFEQQP
jgi:hypothetical protein